MNAQSERILSAVQSDIVIIGGGGAGLAAALTAAESGVTNIVVLEKRSNLGGNTARAIGLFACESPTQAREKIIADKDELFGHAMRWAHWSRVNPRIFRAFLNKSGDTIRWLEEKGLEFNVIAFFPNQNPRVEHVPKGKGAQLTHLLAEKCRQAGVKILLDCQATKLICNSEPSISGVIAAGAEGSLQIDSKCVIMATGGFGGNKTLLENLCPHYYQDMPLRGLPLTGDGVQMAAAAGAAIDTFVSLLKEGPRVDANTWPLSGLEREPVTLWVNKNGRRYVDESAGAHPFESVNAMLNQPQKVNYSLIDSGIKLAMTGKIDGLERSLQSEINKDRVKSAHSWPEIARWMGADPDVLQSTVEEYNAFCDTGYDALFAKERRYLKALNSPPYYAIRGYPYILDTMGGIIVDEHMHALDMANHPFRGLFAAGVTTSGWESESYCSDLSGSAFGYAINSGRIAGENAAQFIQGR